MRRYERARLVLLDPHFTPWFWGNLLSNSGNWLFNVVSAILIYQASQSALMVGVLSAFHFGPLIFLAPLSGWLADRFDRRKVLLSGLVLSCSFAAILAMLAIMSGPGVSPSPWQIIGFTAGIGVGQAISNPSLNSLVPELVSRNLLPDGIALTSMTFGVGRALGPALAGVLLTSLGSDVALVVNALTYLPLVVFLSLLRLDSARRRGGEQQPRPPSYRVLLSDRTILVALLGVALVSFAADPVITLSPALAARILGGEGLVSGMVTAFGLSAALASGVSGSLQARFGSSRVSGLGSLGLGLGLLVTSVAQVSNLLILGFALNGAGFALATTSLTTVIQTRVIDSIRGRIMALWGVCFLGARPIAGLVHGWTADHVSLYVALHIGVVCSVGVLLVVKFLNGRGA